MFWIGLIVGSIIFFILGLFLPFVLIYVVGRKDGKLPHNLKFFQFMRAIIRL